MEKSVHDRADAVVVGCGVAGGMLAGLLAGDGHRVVALEKRPVVGVPVRCGEGAGSREEISRFIPIEEEFIATELNGVRLFSPGMRSLEKRMPGFGLMLKRDKFDQALARWAQVRGADVRTHHEAIGLERDKDRVAGVRVKDHAAGTTYSIRASITVGADGVESFVGRWAGLSDHLKPREIHSAVEYVLEGDGLPSDTIELYVGKNIAPGGYAWIFPKGNRQANVGLGVHPQMAQNGTARDYLDRFVGTHTPGCQRKGFIAGGVSGSKPLKTMVGDGVLLVGEAARHNNPFSGGGIMNSLEGAEEAHKVLTRALTEGDTSRESLKAYDRAWHNRNGRTIHKFALLRELFFKLDDDDLNNLVSVLDGIARARDGRIADYTEVFREAFKTTPGVLWKAGRLLW
jgi:digeranylgeranylglycerophospholipid reductase